MTVIPRTPSLGHTSIAHSFSFADLTEIFFIATHGNYRRGEECD
jgi:hypothetical protein